MCNQCETEINKEQEELFDEPEFQPTYENSFIPPIQLAPEEIVSDKRFLVGLGDNLWLAGAITALVNVGVHPSEALNYFINRETISNNIEIAKIQKEMNIEMSKNKASIAEDNQI